MIHTDNTIAPGHNPDGLTVAQVGDGYRLLTAEEIFSRHIAKAKDDPRIWCWCFEDGGCWCDGYDGANACYTYRVADDCLSYPVEPPAPQIDWQARASFAEAAVEQLREQVRWLQANNDACVDDSQLIAAEQAALVARAEREDARQSLGYCQEQLAAALEDKEKLARAAEEVLDSYLLEKRVQGHPCPQNMVICWNLRAAIDAARNAKEDKQ